MFTIFTCRFSLANRHWRIHFAIITVICFAGSIRITDEIQWFIGFIGFIVLIRHGLVAKPKVRHNNHFYYNGARL